MKIIVSIIVCCVLLPHLLCAQALSLVWNADPQLNALYIRQHKSVEVHPMLPMVFFAKNGSVPQRHVLFTTAAQAADFKPDTIGSILTAQRNYLNCLGYSLQKNPSDAVTLIGYSGGDDGALTLASARAETVRAYLVDIWKIGTERITIKTAALPAVASDQKSEEGREENRRVEIVSGQQEIMPIVAHTITGTPEPMATSFSVEASSTAFSNREIHVWYNGMPWAVLPLGKTDSTVSWDWRSDSGKTIPMPEGILKAEVIGMTESGEIRRSKLKPMEVKLHGPSAEQAGAPEQTYRLICYPDEQRSFGAINTASINTYIAPAITEASTVSIVTYTDGLSTKEKQRVQLLAKSIGGRLKFDAKWKKKNLRTIASNERLVGTHSAEERLLGKMIQVTITPAPVSK